MRVVVQLVVNVSIVLRAICVGILNALPVIDAIVIVGIVVAALERRNRCHTPRAIDTAVRHLVRAFVTVALQVLRVLVFQSAAFV
jgi:hypothetical protein